MNTLFRRIICLLLCAAAQCAIMPMGELAGAMAEVHPAEQATNEVADPVASPEAEDPIASLEEEEPQAAAAPEDVLAADALPGEGDMPDALAAPAEAAEEVPAAAPAGSAPATDSRRAARGVLGSLSDYVCVPGDYTYTVSNGAVSITGYSGRDAKLRLPDNLDGAPVTQIANNAFQYRTDITAVALPEGLTAIGNYAFQNCSALARISLPASLTSISNNAFQGCPNVALHVPRTSMGLVYAVDYGYPFVIENDTVSSNNIIDFSQSLYYANTDGANVNGCIAATLDCAVRDSVSVSGASLVLKVPNGTEVVETTRSLDGAMLKNYTIDNGRLTVPVGQQARGSLRFTLRLTSPVTELLSYAYLSCRANGTKTATWKQRGFQAAVSSFVWIKWLKPGKTWALHGNLGNAETSSAPAGHLPLKGKAISMSSPPFGFPLRWASAGHPVDASVS